MIASELQHIVVLELFCLATIAMIIVAAFKRWKKILCANILLATVAFFSAWSNIMAIGALMVYGSSSLLLWIQQDKEKNRSNKKAQTISWMLLATGVMVLIINNIHNIYLYLNLNQPFV